MSSPLDRGFNQQRRRPVMAPTRSVFGYWIPLAVTVAAATVGIAAWVLRERRGSVDAAETERQRRRRDPQNRRPSVQKRSSSHNEADTGQGTGAVEVAKTIYDQARQGVADGVEGVKESVQRRTGSSSGERKEDVQEQARDEARRAKRKALQTERSFQRQTQAKRKLVAIVVSAAAQARITLNEEQDSSISSAQSSILAHLDPHVDEETTQLVILLYAPHLRTNTTSSLPRSGSTTRTPPAEDESSNPADTSYEAISQQAQRLVSHPTHVLPFSTPSGHIHILRHMSPSVVYMQESLCGDSGELVDMVNGWVGQIVVVVGGEGPGGGLVDSDVETDDEAVDAQKSFAEPQDKWWQNEKKVGLGKGLEVVDLLRIGDDWRRRVEQ